MNRIPLQMQTPQELTAELAKRIRDERLRLGLKQETLAKMSGVSLPTVRRYERTGSITVINLLKLCHALGRLDDFSKLLLPPPANSIAELEERSSIKPPRKRGIR
jgi:transcriptional regulator with XRE-family HTH domain